MALSKKFRWVEVNRDHNPEIPKEFQVNAYPSLIVVNDKREKIYRFQSFKKPAEFIPELNEGLRRHKLYKEGKKWDLPPPRPQTICDVDGVEVQTFRAPSEDQAGGAAVFEGQLWTAQGKKLYRVNLGTGKKEAEHDLPQLVRGLCAGKRFLYGVDYGWTAGRPIYVIDPANGKVVRQIVTEVNKENRYMSAAGITWAGDKLYVLAPRGRLQNLYQVDPKTGDILKVTNLPERSWKLAFDGKNLVTATHVSEKKSSLMFVDPETLRLVRKVPVNYPIGALAAHGGNYLLLEHPVRGYNTRHQRVRLWPKQMLVYQLKLPQENAPR